MSRLFLTNPPAAPAAGRAPLSIARIVRRSFDVPTVGAGPDPELEQFLTDLVAPYGLAHHPDPVAETYSAMAEELLRPVGLLATPVDLVVVAHAVTDADPRPSAAHRLNRLCPGDPLAFAVSDQGVAAPFTALALARAYLHTGDCRRALVLVLEQAALPYPAAAPVRLPEQASAVALVLERDGPGRVRTVEQLTDIGPDRVGDVLAELVATAPEAVLVLGSALARHLGEAGVPAARLRVAPTGQQCTAVWWELADVLDAGDGQSTVVADYDPDLACLGVVTLGAG